MRNFRVVLAVAVIAAIASLSACFPSPGDIFGGGGGSGSPASVSGKWSILLTSNHGASNNADIEANFSQSTGAISAMQSLILSSSPCDFGTDFIQGTVKGSNINFTLAFGTGHPTTSFSGSVSNDGLSMAGSYKMPSGDCASADSGTWAATKFGDSSGTYSGQLTSNVTSRVITALAAIQEDASNNLQANISPHQRRLHDAQSHGHSHRQHSRFGDCRSNDRFRRAGIRPIVCELLPLATKSAAQAAVLLTTGAVRLSQVVPNVVRRPNASAKINPLTNSLLQKIQENRHR